MGILKLDGIAEITGIATDVLAPGIVLLSAYLLTLPFGLLRSPWAKSLFSITTSSALFMALFNDDDCHTKNDFVRLGGLRWISPEQSIPDLFDEL
ncbi:hypothetical protein HK100_009793 [Physocladia obscura]|uniref:Uncharacterized protein n=1 Tax=Physocladia obscura TaxID=109957 RepID=A0AAD5T335_9FUNG|nr:hypothetical protein HK100_009793 [Physocladia obscura]